MMMWQVEYFMVCSTRKRGITILNHDIVNKVASTISAT